MPFFSGVEQTAPCGLIWWLMAILVWHCSMMGQMGPSLVYEAHNALLAGPIYLTHWSSILRLLLNFSHHYFACPSPCLIWRTLLVLYLSMVLFLVGFCLTHNHHHPPALRLSIIEGFFTMWLCAWDEPIEVVRSHQSGVRLISLGFCGASKWSWFNSP